MHGSAALPLFLTSVILAAAQAASAGGLPPGANLFLNPDFEGSGPSCVAGWRTEALDEPCNAADGTIWLKRSSLISPAIGQRVDKLKPGHLYTLSWKWRTGGSPAGAGDREPPAYLAVAYGDTYQPYRLPARYGQWRTDALVVIAGAPSTTFEFRGEYLGPDSRIGIDWVALVPRNDVVPDVSALSAEEVLDLGLAYYRGSGVKRDSGVAFALLDHAAARGHLDARVWVGLLYERGHGVPRNYDRAFDNYGPATAQGHGAAHYRMGLLYERDLGLLKSSEETMSAGYRLRTARDHYRSAVAKGVKEALIRIAFVSSAIAALPGVPAAVAEAPSVILSSNEGVTRDFRLSSPSGTYYLLVRNRGRDGTISVFRANGNVPVWEVVLPDSPVSSLTMRADGNLVAETPDGRAVWRAPLARPLAGSALHLTDEGVLSIIPPSQVEPAWQAASNRR